MRCVVRGCVSLSFWRLWPLQMQLQWLIGVTLAVVRLSYIICNFFDSFTFYFWKEICSNKLYCCSDSSMFRSFLLQITVAVTVLVVKLFFFRNCCSDSFVEKLKNLIPQSYLYSVLRKKKLLFFFSQFIGMLTLWLDDRWLVHMDTQVSDGVAIDGLVNGGVLVFTMLRTYTSSKSGLSVRKSGSNSGDATISLRMVNKDTSWTCITLLCMFTH